MNTYDRKEKILNGAKGCKDEEYLMKVLPNLKDLYRGTGRVLERMTPP